MNIPLFVYGSLRKDLQNNYKLESAVYKGLWYTKNEYYMIGMKSGAYPYVTDEKLYDELVSTKIYGELYLVNEELLTLLDKMEGHPTQYKRKYVEIIDGLHTQTAYMYILVNEELKKGIRENFGRRFVAINHGDWLTYKMKL